MVLELHVWGPAFGLPSVDPECLATILYFAHALPDTTQWRLIASIPPSTPAQTLPSLHDPSTDTWTAGFANITTYLARSSRTADLDRALTSSQRADTAAYTSFLAQHTAPLLSLSLYVSSANWVAATRPAYSALLPVPLSWTEAPALRAAHARRAEHLGLSALETDRDDVEQEQEDRDAAAARRAGFLQLPAALRRKQRPQSVSAALAPEDAARIRLDGLAGAVFDVLAELKGAKKYLLRDEGGPTSLDCLAFGYMALMLVPDVPRPFLRETMRTRYSGLATYVNAMRLDLADGSSGRTFLPWVGDGRSNSLSWTATGHSLVSLVNNLPEAGPAITKWWTRWRRRRLEPHQPETKKAQGQAVSDMLVAICGSAMLVALVAGFAFYRQLPPFGSAVYRWEALRRGRSFGAVGAMLGLGSTWNSGGPDSGRPPRVDGNILDVSLDMSNASQPQDYEMDVAISIPDDVD